MVILSETYLQNLERKSTTEAILFHIIIKIFRGYIVNKDALFTVFKEPRSCNKSLNVLDSNIANTIYH